MKRPYHPSNLKLQPYAAWRVIALAWTGAILGVQFKIGGIPFGGAALKSGSSCDSVERGGGAVVGLRPTD
jgi:hypothetical protein